MSGRTPVNVWATTPAAPGRYQLDMSRLSLREIFRMSPGVLTALIAVVLFKVLRLKHLGTPHLIDYPARLVDIEDGEVPGHLAAPLRSATDDLVALGFSPRWTYMQDSPVMRPAVARVFLSPDGRTSAQALIVTDDATDPHTGAPKVKASVCFTSGRDGDGRLWTIDQPRDVENPFEPFITRLVAGTPAALWERHQATLSEAGRVPPLLNDDEVRRQIERDNNRSMEISIARRLHVLVEP